MLGNSRAGSKALRALRVKVLLFSCPDWCNLLIIIIIIIIGVAPSLCTLPGWAQADPPQIFPFLDPWFPLSQVFEMGFSDPSSCAHIIHSQNIGATVTTKHLFLRITNIYLNFIYFEFQGSARSDKLMRAVTGHCDQKHFSKCCVRQHYP